jgi:thiol-disulfide isomerase/thioredoxin
MVSSTTLFIIAGLLWGAGGGLIYWFLQKRPNLELQGVLEWAGMTVSILFLLGGAGLTMLAVSENTSADFLAQDRSVIGTPAPELRFRMVDSNEERSLSDFEGKVVLLNLWATWCPPCLDELPELNRLQEAYGSKGLVVVTISDERRETIQRFEREQLKLRTVSGYLPDAWDWPSPYDRVLKSRPTSFVIDRQGIIQKTWPGAKELGFFEQAVWPHF